MRKIFLICRVSSQSIVIPNYVDNNNVSGELIYNSFLNSITTYFFNEFLKALLRALKHVLATECHKNIRSSRLSYNLYAFRRNNEIVT